MRCSGSFGNFTCLQATGADPQALGLTVHFGPNFLEIGIKPSQRQIVGVTLVIADAGLFPADFAYSGHLNHLSEPVNIRLSEDFASRIWLD